MGLQIFGDKMNWLSGLFSVAFYYINKQIINRVLLLIVLFIVIELIFGKILNPQLELGLFITRLFTILYVVIQITIVFISIYSLRNILFPKNKKDVIETKESYDKLPEDFTDFRDIDKFPKL